MSKQNVKLVQSFYEATSRGDFVAAGRLLDPQIEWIEPDAPGWWFSGTHRGPEAVFQEVIEPSKDKFDAFHLELDQFLDSGNQVVVTGSFLGRRKNAGAELNVPFVHIWKVADERLVHFQNFVDTADMQNALGSAPPAFADAGAGAN